jgi:serine protease
MIVRLAEWAEGDRVLPMAADHARNLSVVARTRLEPMRRMSGGAHVVRLTHDMPVGEVEAITARLMRDPDVVHAEPDHRKFALRAPADPLYPRQWNLFESAGGINAPLAWDVTVGSPAVAVAVIDTGILPLNIDLAGRLAVGYDFIREDAPGLFLTANDADGRDTDPADPGSWVSAAEAGQGPFAACPQPEDSSWHGTHIAGIIAASADNAYGIAGIAWGVRVLPARALGKCGGYTSDIIDALRWSAGIPVSGLPSNPNPAQVVNMSLGGRVACGIEEQRAIDDALATGRVKAIVAAAGNDAGDSAGIAPANCRGVLAVTATDRAGFRASYAAAGANIAIAAPGGFFLSNAASAADGILSLFNAGRTVPAGDAFAYAAGTSEAAAHVSGVAALVLSVNPGLTADELKLVLQTSARAFPTATCTTSVCGAGIVDAAAAVTVAAGALPTASPQPAPNTAIALGGGGGCALARDGAPEVVLPLACLWAFIGILRRARRRAARA